MKTKGYYHDLATTPTLCKVGDIHSREFPAFMSPLSHVPFIKFKQTESGIINFVSIDKSLIGVLHRGEITLDIKNIKRQPGIYCILQNDLLCYNLRDNSLHFVPPSLSSVNRNLVKIGYVVDFSYVSFRNMALKNCYSGPIKVYIDFPSIKDTVSV